MQQKNLFEASMTVVELNNKIGLYTLNIMDIGGLDEEDTFALTIGIYWIKNYLNMNFDTFRND